MWLGCYGDAMQTTLRSHISVEKLIFFAHSTPTQRPLTLLTHGDGGMGMAREGLRVPTTTTSYYYYYPPATPTYQYYYYYYYSNLRDVAALLEGRAAHTEILFLSCTYD